ncbi:MAG: hypothetical protein M3N53_00040 [Actinomycetota bacterium]|nr:hypothetical protein [Actinomycetota bacterium]
MDPLTFVMISAFVAGMAFYVYRMTRHPREPADLPPGSMTVDRFYAENPLRRESQEIDLGDGWRDAADPTCTFSVFWIEQTGEVYALRVPNPPSLVHDGVGDYGLSGSAFAAATVEVLGHARTRDELDERLGERDTKIAGPDGISWIRSQLSSL